MPSFHRSLILGLLVATGPVPAKAGFLTGNELLRACQANGDISQCRGYLEGAVDAAENFQCVPAQTEPGQVQEIVVKYLTAHVELRQTRAADLVFLAVTDAWPCPKTPRKK